MVWSQDPLLFFTWNFWFLGLPRVGGPFAFFVRTGRTQTPKTPSASDHPTPTTTTPSYKPSR
jgi:hypothetical protein